MRDRGDAPQKPPAQREIRPFPAIDPEPEHRYSRRAAARAAIACVAACAVAAAALAGVRLADAKHPPQAAAPARFTDRDGLIVFEEQPSGLLGTASPDGTHPVTATSLGPLQGSDLAVGAPDGRYLIDEEAELVTIGAHGGRSSPRSRRRMHRTDAGGTRPGVGPAHVRRRQPLPGDHRVRPG